MPAPVCSLNACVACSWAPPEEPASWPLYAHESGSYLPVSGSKPENTPSRSSVSRNSSPTIVEAFV